MDGKAFTIWAKRETGRMAGGYEDTLVHQVQLDYTKKHHESMRDWEAKHNKVAVCKINAHKMI